LKVPPHRHLCRGWFLGPPAARALRREEYGVAVGADNSQNGRCPDRQSRNPTADPGRPILSFRKRGYGNSGLRARLPKTAACSQIIPRTGQFGTVAEPKTRPYSFRLHSAAPMAKFGHFKAALLGCWCRTRRMLQMICFGILQNNLTALHLQSAVARCHQARQRQ
jgi:hypothetical protein